MLTSFNPFKNAFGLDFSDLVLRLVQFKRISKKIELHCYNELPLPTGVISEGEIKNQAKLKESIKKLLATAQGAKLNTKYVIASLPERKTFIKVIEVPKMAKGNLNDTIGWEAAQHIPMNLEEVYLDWQVVGEEKDSGKLKVLVGVAPKNLVDDYTKVLEEVDLKPLALEIESVAILRSLIKEKEIAAEAKLIIDIGRERMTLIIYDQGTIQFTASTSAISGRAMTETIASKLNLNSSQAEKAKIIYGLEAKKEGGQLIKALEPIVDQLVIKITEVINFYNNHFSNPNKLKTIVLTGGSSQLKNLDFFLKQKTGLKIEKANPLVNLTLEGKRTVPQEKILSFPTAIGLALRGIDSNDNH